jgi:hypothetical protein
MAESKCWRRIESKPSRMIMERQMNHHPQAGKPTSHSATPELLQLLNSRAGMVYGHNLR